MKITGIRTLRLLGPRVHSTGGAASKIGKILVRIDTDAGVYGLGEAEGFIGVREAIDYIGVCVMGRSPFDVRPIVSEMLYGSLPPHSAAQRALPVGASAPSGAPLALGSSPTATPTGAVIWAAAGVEIALCDLVGKALDTPVYNLLGGRFRDRVRVYLDRSSPGEPEKLEAWKQMGAAAVSGGFDFIKFDADYTAPDYTQDCWNRTLPTAQIRRIVERIGAVRQEVGPDVELCVDCHMSYNASDAVRLARALAPLDLRWFEDPTPMSNPDACADVRDKSPLPICAGEMFTAEGFRTFIDHGACDIVHPDVLFCGGLHEAMRIAGYAELHYMPMAMHGNGGALAAIASAHVGAAARNFLGLEFHHIETEWIVNMVRREGVPLFSEGHIPLTDAPGLGVELDLDICRRFAAAGETPF